MRRRFSELDKRLIDVLWSVNPDFSAAEELITQGADVNAYDDFEEGNLLSEIIEGFWSLSEPDDQDCECEEFEEDDENEDDDEFEDVDNTAPQCGEAMCRAIRFILEHGFDVKRNNGMYGAQCIKSLQWSTFDRYMIDAARILFDAGARDASTDPDDSEWTAMGSIGSKVDYSCMQGYHSTANHLEAIYQMFSAIEEGRPYAGIDSYVAALDKRITRVLAEKPETGSVFYTIDLPTFKHDQCFIRNLYFMYDGGALVTTQYADIWVDTHIPDEEKLVDVSEYFEPVIGQRISGIRFKHSVFRKYKTDYGRPIVRIIMENGLELVFSINFGEVKDKDRAAFFELRNAQTE